MIRGNPWTPQDEFILRKLYPTHSVPELAEILGRTQPAVTNMAVKLRLRKSAKYLRDHKPGQFRKGQVPHNKGLRRPGWAPGRMAQTQFKKGAMAGAAQHNYVPIGSLRVTKDGTLERKVTDDPSLAPARRWTPVHRLVWEAEHGPVPAGMLAVFKPGRKTAELSKITADAVEVIDRAENMRRNTVHRYPKEIAQLVQLRGALMRQINKRTGT